MLRLITDWLPRPLASYLRAQPPEILMLAGGVILTAIVIFTGRCGVGKGRNPGFYESEY